MLAWSFIHLVHRYENDRLREQSRRRLTDVAFQIESKISHISVVLEVARSFLESRNGEAVTRDRFRRFHRHLDEAGLLQGIQGLGFAAVVTPETLSRIEERIRQGYGVTRQIWPGRVPGQLQAVITLLEPPDARNMAALGYDMFSEEHRRTAMTAAMLSDEPQLTAPLTLVQEITPDRQVGVLMYVYIESDLNNEEPGFLYAPLRLGQLFGGLLRGSHSGYELQVLDPAAQNPVLHETPGYTEAVAHAARDGVVWQDIAAGGRQWRLSLADGKSRSFLIRQPMTSVTAALALLSAVLSTLAAWGLQNYLRSTRALGLAQARNLAQKDLHLREMSHRLKNVLARVLAIARQTGARAPDKAALMSALTSRLQGMAAAQDLLVRGADHGASLRSLIMTELDQVYGPHTDQLSVDGPEVRLSVPQTEALGLVFHELATNALKYGAGAVAGGVLKITWDVSPDEVVITWTEDCGQPLPVPSQPGFGTRLIDSSVQQSLGGSITRSFHSSGLTICLRFAHEGLEPPTS